MLTLLGAVEWLTKHSKLERSKGSNKKRVKMSLKLDDIFECRQNPEAYSLVFDYLLVPVVGKRVLDDRLKPQRQSINQICTPSDEAFVLLVLENCWDNWLDTYVLFDGKFRPQKRKEGNDDIIRSLKDFKFTSHKNGDSNFYQWRSEGIKRFNELHEIVVEQRREFEEVDREWLNRVYEEAKSKDKRKRTSDCYDAVIPANDLHLVPA